MDFYRLQIKDFFSDLTFEPKAHKYFVNGVPIKESVSKKITRFKKPFNKHSTSLGTANIRGITQQEVLKEWDQTRDESLRVGNEAHLFGELYAFNRKLRPQSNFDLAIMKFWEDLPDYLVIVAIEAQMYHKTDLWAGTADILLFNKLTGKFIIADYKTNKDLFKNFKGQTLLERFSTYLDNPFNGYQIQLSYYQILIEQLGFEVSHRKIIWLKPNGTYELYDCEDLTQYLRE